MEWEYAKQVIHRCHKKGWPIARIVRLVPQFTAPEIEKILSQPCLAVPEDYRELLETGAAVGACGCGRSVRKGRKWASPNCRQRAYYRRGKEASLTVKKAG